MEDNHFIGEELKQARLKKGYTLDDLQQLTKIQKRYLIAIEENNLEELPGDFFVKAFIRQYAEVVEVPLKEEGFLADSTHTASNIPQQHVPSRSELKRSSKETKFRYGSSSQNSSLPTFLMVLFFILIVGIIWFYFNFMRENPAELNPNDNQPQVVTPSVSSSNDSSETSENPAVESEEGEAEDTVMRIVAGESMDGEVIYTVYGLNLPNRLTMNVDTSGRSWMQVLLEGEVVFEGTLEAGTSQEVDLPSGIENISVRVGYIPATTIIFGEELVVPNPENGEIVQTQTFIFEIEPLLDRE